MRIDELTGIKNTPFVKATKVNPPYNPDMDAPEQSHADQINHVVDELHKVGWKTLGKGFQAHVLEHSGYPFVLKIVKNGDSYIEYIKVANSMPNNPFFVKTRGKGVNFGNEIYALRLEKLSEIASYKDPFYRKYIDPSLECYCDNLVSEENEEFLKENWPDLLQALSIIFKKWPDNDLAHGNYMRRGDTLVITDPVL